MDSPLSDDRSARDASDEKADKDGLVGAGSFVADSTPVWRAAQSQPLTPAKANPSSQLQTIDTIKSARECHFRVSNVL